MDLGETPKGRLDRLRNSIGEFWDDKIEKRRRRNRQDN